MPDRIIRDELMRSRRFRRLPDDSARILFIYLLLSADPFGNLEIDADNIGAMLRRELDDDELAQILAPLIAADLLRPYQIDGKQLGHIPRYRQRLKYGSGVIHRPPKDIEDPWIQQALNNKYLREKDGMHTGTSEDNPGTGQAASGTTRARPLAGTIPQGPRHDVEVKRSEVKRSDVEVNRPPPPVDNSQAERTPAKTIGEILHPLKPNGHSPPSAPPTPPPSKGNAPTWAHSEAGIAKRSMQLGLPANPGESWQSWRDRLIAADRQAKRRP